MCSNTEWSEWTDCDAELGGWGQKFRYRECDCPPGGDAENPDCGCGPNEECETCKGEPLCEWTPWTAEGPCSVTCGGGTEPRERTCVKKDTNGDDQCPTPEDIDEGCEGEFKEESPCSIGKLEFIF